MFKSDVTDTIVLPNFDAIRIINLAYRSDRRSEMIGELKRIGLFNDARVKFFNAISVDDAGPFTSRGARGVYHSHLAVLEEAAAAQHSVLVLEDDVDFVAALPDYRLPPDWRIFYGGYDAQDPGDLFNSDIIGAHFMGFHSSVVPTLVSFLRETLNADPPPPIDGAYVWFRRAHPEIPTVFAEPKLGHQRPSRTDIADLRFFDQLPVLRFAASLARRLKRRFLSPVRRPTFAMPDAIALAFGAISVAAFAVWAVSR